jgi:hypothetical protein
MFCIDAQRQEVSKEDKHEGDQQLGKKSQDIDQISDEALDEKTVKKLRKLNEKTIKKLGKLYEDYINSAIQQPLPERSAKSERSKGDNLLRNFEESIFNWDNKATKKPAFDAFKNVFTGFDKLGGTFDAKQKEIVAETDFGENMATMVALMRQHIEASDREANSRRRRFYVSMTVAVVSTAIALVAFLL